MAIDNLKSDQFRDILVTDIEWRFDYDLRDLITLREGDTVDRTSEPGWIVLTLQPRTPGGFPEVIRHQVSKIISERNQLRVMKVRLDPPSGQDRPDPPVPPVAPAGPSESAPDAPASPVSGVSGPADAPSPSGLIEGTLVRLPAPRRRAPRRTPSAPPPTGE